MSIIPLSACQAKFKISHSSFVEWYDTVEVQSNTDV